MYRKVFYSFHYRNDISRVMAVRNRWVTYGNQTMSGIIDSAEFEKIQKQGESAIKRWINQQLEGTSATIVLIGAETLNRPYVKYEISRSIERGNAVIGVYINKIRDFNRDTSTACSKYTIIDYDTNNNPIWFSDIANAIYDYVDDDGYSNLDTWVEEAIKNM